MLRIVVIIARMLLKPPAARKKSLVPPHEVAEALGFDAAIERIENGDSMREIAGELGVSVGFIHGWLRSSVERSARVDAAMEMSAESWLDRGLNELTTANSKNAVLKARAIEQHCARRAAIRNPKRYGDKIEVDNKHSGGVTVVTATGPQDDTL